MIRLGFFFIFKEYYGFKLEVILDRIRVLYGQLIYLYYFFGFCKYLNVIFL